ncbi:MAG: IPT/TIG domain-containing protein, partial [Bdellovibrionales bacterium]|nr:IPT/TIG domain-containing protein [Bdellovibrionales bacterium]
GGLYGTDNGANEGFGDASISSTQTIPAQNVEDEVVRLFDGHYYGHPNRNRGRYFTRENTYHFPTDSPEEGLYTSPLALVTSSSNGIDQYRATTFDSALRSNLLVQKWNGPLFNLKLSPNGLSVVDVGILSNFILALDILASPGGSLVHLSYTGNSLLIRHPNDATTKPMQAYDIFPWRGKAGYPFVIGGFGFGNIENTSVKIGGFQADLSYVSSKRIKGSIPTAISPSSNLLDIEVSSAGKASVIKSGFRYLLSPGEGTGVWNSHTDLPVSLGEVAAGIIDGRLFIVGEGSDDTFAFDFATGTWTTLAQRPFHGHHHAAEVYDGNLYLIGGLEHGSEGKVQIYDPKSDTWSLGADLPLATGSGSSALIEGKIYYGGGIFSNSITVPYSFVYDPKLDQWSQIADMPVGRNHAASISDGSKWYIFGGRGNGSGDGNYVAEGFDDVQIYDPASNSWEWNYDPGSLIPALPQKRGGMGKAVFFQGEFYIFGGETTPQGSGQVAGNVYDRVDVYNPTTNSWRLDAPMSFPRHGIFPLLYNDRILLPGGD